MRRTILTVIIAALAALPVFAQEEGGGDGAAGIGPARRKSLLASITSIQWIK